MVGNILDSVCCAGIIEIPKWRQRAMTNGMVKWFRPSVGWIAISLDQTPEDLNAIFGDAGGP